MYTCKFHNLFVKQHNFPRCTRKKIDVISKDTKFPNYWNDANNQKQFLDSVAKKLNIKQMSDWYNVSHKVDFDLINTSDKDKDLLDVGGRSVLQKHKESPLRLLSSVYPEHEWLPWKFNCPRNFWKDANNQRKFMDWAAKELKLKEMDDWYNVTEKVYNLVNFQVEIVGFLQYWGTGAASNIPRLTCNVNSQNIS
jgi:hypothetical protein